jgi:hypothetical protein
VIVGVVLCMVVVAMIFAPRRKSPDEIMACPCPRCGYGGGDFDEETPIAETDGSRGRGPS